MRLQEYPELIPVVNQALDAVINSRNINRQHHAALVQDAEQTAAAAALTTYEQLVKSAIQASDAADEAGRVRAVLVAANAEAIAEVVADAAAEMHNVEDAAADHVARVAANTASELATLLDLDDETAASTAAAVVIKAVSEATAIRTEATAHAASTVAQAAADAAADLSEQAASTGLAAEDHTITNAFDRHQDALQICYEAAAAAAVLTFNADLLQAHHPPETRKPA